MISENEALMAENAKLSMMAQDLLEQRDRAIKDCLDQEKKNKDLQEENAKLRHDLAYAKGCAEAYVHCINAMYGVENSKKNRFRKC